MTHADSWGRRIWYHPWIVVACNIALLMVLYTLSRLFFYYVNRDLFSDISFSHMMELCLGGTVFDRSTVLFFNSLYLLLALFPWPEAWRSDPGYRKAIQWSYWIPNTICLIANCMDMVYFRFTDRRTTCRVFTEFQHDNNLLSIFSQAAVQYWYVTVFGIVLLAAFFLLSRRPPVVEKRRNPWVYYITESIIISLTAFVTVVGIRNGVHMYTRVINVSYALEYTNEPIETGIVLNTPFSMIRSLENLGFEEVHYYDEQEMEEIFTPIHPAPDTLVTGHEGMNVVIFILESFSKEYIGFFNHDLDNGTYQGYTPFLDSLLEHSRSYRLSLASGRKSIEAMPSTLASLQLMYESYILTPYSTNDISSLAHCLTEKGYSSGFWHGAPSGSMGFNAFARAAGFQSNYGFEQYDGPEAFDGTWAVWDDEFLQFFLRGLNRQPQPFCTAIFTASSHQPFKVPEQYRDTFPEGPHPLHKCIGYSDHALRHFFRCARTQPWYQNTLFVFTADHTNEITHAEYNNAKGLFEIPIFFYRPDDSLTGLQDDMIAQVDIMPSVLGYLGYDKPYFAFGEDVLTRPREHRYIVNYNYPVHQIFSDSLLVQFDEQKVTAVYNFKRDRVMKHNLVDEMRDTEEVQHMVRYLKAYIQQYVSRMINNDLKVKDAK